VSSYGSGFSDIISRAEVMLSREWTKAILYIGVRKAPLLAMES
jgi:hypothetical protein